MARNKIEIPDDVLKDDKEDLNHRSDAGDHSDKVSRDFLNLSICGGVAYGEKLLVVNVTPAECRET